MNNRPAIFPLLLFFYLILFSQSVVPADNPRYFNERFVINAMSTFTGAQYTYQGTYGNGNFGTLAELGDAALIDPVLATGEKYGYSFVVVKVDRDGSAPARFYVTATPRRYRKTGIRSFYVNESSSIHGADHGGAPANSTDPFINSCLIGNERCVTRSLRTLQGAQYTYQANFGNFGSLAQLRETSLIDESLGAGVSHDYFFTCTVTVASGGMPAAFEIRAVPAHYGVSGFRSFYINTEGVMRGADHGGAPAGPDDPPIDE